MEYRLIDLSRAKMGGNTFLILNKKYSSRIEMENIEFLTLKILMKALFILKEIK